MKFNKRDRDTLFEYINVLMLVFVSMSPSAV